MRHLALALAFILLLAPAHAQTVPGAIAVQSAWARATPAGARTGAVYLTLVNNGAAEDELVAASTPVADRAQLHTERIENGVMKMRPSAAVDVKPGATVMLKPGGVHVMLIGLKQPLKEGESFPLTLEFARGGKREVEVRVAGIGAMGMSDGGAMGHDSGHSPMEMEKR